MSKSVKLRISDAAAGTAKKIVIAASAGAVIAQPARASRVRPMAFTAPSPCPASSAAFPAAGRRAGRSPRCGVDAILPAHHAFGDDLHFGDDPLPLGNLRQRRRMVELGGKGRDERIARQPRFMPYRPPRGQAARQLMEGALRGGRQEAGQHLPRGGDIVAAGKDDKAATRPVLPIRCRSAPDWARFPTWPACRRTGGPSGRRSSTGRTGKGLK